MTDSPSNASTVSSSSGSTTQSDGPMPTLADVAREAAIFLQRMSQESRESQLTEAETEAPASSRRRKVPAYKRAPTNKSNTAPPSAPIATQPAPQTAPAPAPAAAPQLQQPLLRPAVSTVINQPICHCAAMPQIHVHVQAAPAPVVPQAPRVPQAPQAPQAPRVPQGQPAAARHMETKSVGVTSSQPAQPSQSVTCGNLRDAVWNVAYRTNAATSDDTLQLAVKIAKPEDVAQLHNLLCHKIIAPSSDARIALQWRCTGVLFRNQSFGSAMQFSTKSSLAPSIIKMETERLLTQRGFSSSVVRTDFWLRM